MEDEFTFEIHPRKHLQEINSNGHHTSMPITASAGTAATPTS